MKKESIAVILAVIAILAISFLNAPLTGQAVAGESEIVSTGTQFKAVLVGGTLVIFILWYYFKKVREL